MEQPTNKIVLISGSTRGIGNACARLFLQNGTLHSLTPGHTVIITGRSQASVDKALADFKSQGFSNAFGRPCHFARASQVESLRDWVRDRFGRLDVLVNNAATSLHFGTILETTPKAYDKMMDLNVKVVFWAVGNNIELFVHVRGVHSADARKAHFEHHHDVLVRGSHPEQSDGGVLDVQSGD